MNKMNYETKDSGKRQDYTSGMRRDLQDGKPDFYLTMSMPMPYEEMLLTRWASLMTRGAEKYGRQNWQLANSTEELERFKSSATRHFMQAITGEDDEDHMAAVLFNLNAIVYLQWKLANNIKELFDSDESINNDDWLLLYQNNDDMKSISDIIGIEAYLNTSPENQDCMIEQVVAEWMVEIKN